MSQKEKLAVFITLVAGKLKELNTPDDLVRLCIAGSKKTLANYRSNGNGPDFIKIRGCGIRYEKSSVIAWLEQAAVVVEQVRPAGQ